MIDVFMHTLTIPCGVEREDSVLVCCSGGIDSMVLLRLMIKAQVQLNLRLHVVTVDHGLRCESPGDANFVLETCKALGIDASIYELRMDSRIANLEEQARMRRYEAIWDCRKRQGSRYVATGHTMNDQAETVLYRLIRGSGLKGLTGIAYAQPDGLIRPMLDITKAQVEAFARDQGIRFVTDRTNDDLSLTRNLIRKRLLPLMRKINPAVVNAIARFALISREESAYLEEAANALESEALKVDWGVCRIYDLERLKAAHAAVFKRLLIGVVSNMLGEPRGIEAQQVEWILDVLKDVTKAHTVKRRVRVERSGEHLVFSPTSGGPYYDLEVKASGEYCLPAIKQRLRLDIAKGWDGPLHIRSYLPGDRLFGKKVAQILAEHGVMEHLRRFWPVLLSGGEIISVGGLPDPFGRVDLHFPL
jgi:tRNA(Ile)-lysidine synthase